MSNFIGIIYGTFNSWWYAEYYITIDIFMMLNSNCQTILIESLKGAELLAEVMQTHLGYPCFPPPGSYRTDIIQAVRLGTRKKVYLSVTHITF